MTTRFLSRAGFFFMVQLNLKSRFTDFSGIGGFAVFFSRCSENDAA
jgi:hypothetical protein